MTTNKIILNNALLIYILIVVFFLFMKFFGLDEVSELRYLNFLFVFYGVNRAIEMNIKSKNTSNYFDDLFVGFAASALAVAFTIIGLIVHVKFIDQSFIDVLENSNFWGQNLSLVKVVFALAIEGIASSLMCSFILMQYLSLIHI